MKNKISKKITKIDNTYLSTSGNAQFEKKVIDFLDALKERGINESQMILEGILPMLEKHVADSAKETVEKESKHCPYWFS